MAHGGISMRSAQGGHRPREIVRGRARVVVSRDLEALSALAAELFVTLAQQAGEVEGSRFTASLFPGTAVLHDRKHLVAAPWVDKLKTYRITLTPRVLNKAATVVFLVSGAEKAAVLHAVLDGPYDPDQFPAQLVVPIGGTLLWMGDEAAATRL